MEKVFVDPLIHSRRTQRFQIGVVGAALLAVGILIWGSWWRKPEDRSDPRRPLLFSSVLVPAFFAGAYLIRRNRRVLMDRQSFTVSEQGVRWRTPLATTEVPWSAVEEVRIAGRPTQGRSPDVMLKTDAGYLGAYMRWVEADGPCPEPSLLRPGKRFLYPNGERVILSPATSPLVRALREFCPEEKIKEGAIISI